MKASILIVDTDPTVEMMVAECVNDAQAEIEMVSDVRAARDFIDQQSATMLVINADLPKGWRFCTELKKDPNTSPIPLILLSAKATEDVFNEHQRLPIRANAYLRKPIEWDELRLAFMGILAGETMPAIEVDLGIDVVEITEVSGDEEAHALEAEEAQAPEAEGPTGPPAAPDPPAEAAMPEPIVEPVTDVESGLIISERVVAPPTPTPSALPRELMFAPTPSPPPAQPPPTVAAPVAAPSVAAPPSPSSLGDAALSKERDFLKARVDELAMTGQALEGAQRDQALQMEQLRREVEALQAERDVLEDTRQRLATDLEQNQQRQTVLEQALVQVQQSAATKEAGDSDYTLALEAHVEELRGLFVEAADRGAANDSAQRTVMAQYLDRETALQQMRGEETKLTDTLLAVLEHVYEGLDTLRQDIHNGVPPVPELSTLPEVSEAALTPFEAPTLPPKPERPQVAPPAALGPPPMPTAAPALEEEAESSSLLDPQLAADLGLDGRPAHSSDVPYQD